MNKRQLRERTRQLSGKELEDLRSNDEIDVVVDETYRQIGQMMPWKWRENVTTFETEAEVDVYGLPSGISEVQAVTLLDGPSPRPLSVVTVRDVLTRVKRDDHDTPRVYARFGDKQLRLAPTPNRVYTVEVYGQRPLQGMAGDSDEPEWESRFHAAIAYLAAAVLLNEEGQVELGEMRQIRGEELLESMVKHYHINRDTTPTVVGGGTDPEGMWGWHQ